MKQFLDSKLFLSLIHIFLADFGVKEIDAQGKAFDPHFHEALMEIQSDDVDKDTVSAVLQKGYMMGDAVLRPAKVQVAHN